MLSSRTTQHARYPADTPLSLRRRIDSDRRVSERERAGRIMVGRHVRGHASLTANGAFSASAWQDGRPRVERDSGRECDAG